MPTKMFEHLNDEKKNRIIAVALKEFGDNGIVNASTNNIVRDCGISKGSLFKYFQTKDDLCFYLFDLVTNEMLSDLAINMQSFSDELFQRYIDYSVWETSWYISNPVKGRFVIAVASEKDKDFEDKRTKRYGVKSDNVYQNLVKDIPEDQFNVDTCTLSNIIKWVAEGYNKEFLASVDTKNTPLQMLKDEYMKGLTICIDAVKNGVVKN